MVAERWPSQSFMVGDLDAGGTKPYRARNRVPFVQVLWCSLFDQGPAAAAAMASKPLTSQRAKNPLQFGSIGDALKEQKP
jgi:hypothetical protein